MTFSIRPAQRSDSKALIGLYGQSGAGKTMSALLLARGLVGAGKVVMIDTEAGRGALYADVIPSGYEVIDLDPPFTPDRYIEAITAAEKAGADCIVIDSISHEWEGQGGIADMVQAIELRTGRPGLHCWKEPKMAHQKMVLNLLGSKTNVIVCLRAKRKSKQVKDPQTGKSAIIKDEFFTPKQDGDFIFEMTVHAEVQADHTLRVTKVSHPALEAVFKTGVKVSIDTGKQLAAWAKGTAVAAPKEAPAPAPVKNGEWPTFKSLSEWAHWSRDKFLPTAHEDSASAWKEKFAPYLTKLNANGDSNKDAAALYDRLIELYGEAMVRLAA